MKDKDKMGLKKSRKKIKIVIQEVKNFWKILE